MKRFFKKTILSTGLLRLFVLVAALTVMSLPFVSASAAGQNDPSARQVSNERLATLWARQLRLYERMGRTDEFIEKTQQLIDRAEANGKDISAVQTALDAFATQTREAKPIYESMKGIINSHQGFDSKGEVTDPEKARETVRAMRGKFQEIKTIMNGTGKALREAIKAYRESNLRPQATVTPAGA